MVATEKAQLTSPRPAVGKGLAYKAHHHRSHLKRMREVA
jgi:hypothetical protein